MIESSQHFSHFELGQEGILSEDDVYHYDSILSLGFLVLSVSGIDRRWYVLESLGGGFILP